MNEPEDELCDLFPGTGAVTKAWKTWQGKFTLPEAKAPQAVNPSMELFQNAESIQR
jgi:hypothetical protein